MNNVNKNQVFNVDFTRIDWKSLLEEANDANDDYDDYDDYDDITRLGYCEHLKRVKTITIHEAWTRKVEEDEYLFRW